MVALAVACAIAAPVAQAKNDAAPKVLTVCKHGCVYTTIQKAVNASGRKATIKVKPGKYVEGVIVSGHKHDGLHIIGLGKKPSDVVLKGKHAHGPGGAAQNGIDGENVNNLDLENMKAEHYAANGFFINTCHGYLMKNLVAGFNRSYGLYVFRCVGGRMTKSVGFGNGDSAFYVGGTPFEKHPVTTTLDHDTGYENVLGYSGTNSKYIVIRNSEFYNNGAGVVPNTLASEPYEPATSGVIEHNLIYWNNFDYYRPGSPVGTVSGGVGSKRANYPIGAGVILFGTTGWVVKDNSIFGNFLWGGAAFSDPTNTTGKAENNSNKFIDNKMGGPSTTQTAPISTTTGPARAPASRTTARARRSTRARPSRPRSCTRAVRATSAPAPRPPTRLSSASSRRSCWLPAHLAGEVLARPQASEAQGPQALRGVIMNTIKRKDPSQQ